MGPMVHYVSAEPWWWSIEAGIGFGLGFAINHQGKNMLGTDNFGFVCFLLSSYNLTEFFVEYSFIPCFAIR